MRMRMTMQEIHRRAAAEGIDANQVAVSQWPLWDESAPYRVGVRSALISPNYIIRDDGSSVSLHVDGSDLLGNLISFAHSGVEDRRWLLVELFPEVNSSSISIVEIRLRAIAMLGWDTYVARLKLYWDMRPPSPPDLR